MLRGNRKRVVSACWLLPVLILFLLSISTPANYSVCYENEYTNNEHCAPYTIGPLIVFEILKFFTAYNGAITAIATGVIAYFTYTIWRASDDSLSHSRQVERAYVSADAKVIFRGKTEIVGTGRIIAMPELPDSWLSIVLDNNGKTAAFVDEIAVVTCGVEMLTPKPDYRKSERLADISLSPGAREIPTFRFDMRTVAGKIVYGRVYYTDIYKQRHSSGFIRHILSSMATSVEAAPEYTAWD